MHTDEPAMANWPEPHTLHVVDLADDENQPAVHSTQASTLTAGVFGLNVPAGHDVHDVAPAREYSPFAHSVHESDPAELEMVPARHSSWPDWSARALKPGSAVKQIGESCIAAGM